MITTDLNIAIDQLRAGHPVAIPTETVYGLAAPIDQESAIRAVFALKNRPLNHPLIVHVAEHWDLTHWVEEIPPLAQRLIDAFWPGPLTLVLKANLQNINLIITGGQDSVAIRCPKHPLAQALLKELGTPVVAPSANPFGKISPTTAEHVEQSFAQSALTILDGGRCDEGIESTLIHIAADNQYQILRHGTISAEQIAAVLKQSALTQANNLRVPGKLDSHYQPEKPLYYFDNVADLQQFCRNNHDSLFVIASQKPDNVSAENFFALPQTPSDAAFELYFQLRRADLSSAQFLLIELPPDNSNWAGVRERIIKASQKPFDTNSKKS